MHLLPCCTFIHTTAYSPGMHRCLSSPGPCAQPKLTLPAGKGRQLAGLIRMFWEQEGGRRILWLSVSPDLAGVSALSFC